MEDSNSANETTVEITPREKALLTALDDPCATCGWLLGVIDYETGRTETCGNGCYSEPSCQTSPVEYSLLAFPDLRDRFVLGRMYSRRDWAKTDPHPSFQEELERLEAKVYPEGME